MNAVKKILLVLLVVIAILALVSAFLPSKIHVERSVSINRSPKVVFDQVNNLKVWKNWSYWDNIDPNMKSTYEGPESGPGAIHSWSSDHENVGTGSMTIVEVSEPNSILTSLTFGSMSSPSGWTFAESDSGTIATVFIDMEMPLYSRIFPGLMMDEWLGKDFEKTLTGLKNWSEGLAEVKSAPVWEVETVTTEAVPVLSIRVIANQSTFNQKLGESYGRLMEAMGKQGLRQAGPNYAIYYKWSADTVEMEPGVFVDKPGKNDGDITAGSLPSVKAIKVDYYGDYPGTEQAHYFMDEWAKKNNVVIIGPPWEEYHTDPGAEPDTSKWLTKIYYPVE